jgi:uncharacterized membrane protein
MGRGGNRLFLFLLHLIIGLYILNFGFSFISLPDFFTEASSGIVNKIIFFIAGVLVILGGVNWMRANRPVR